MLQRSPTWIGSVPGAGQGRRPARASCCRPRLAHRVIRTKNIVFMLALFNFCQRFPDRARRLLTRMNEKDLDDPAMVAEHFTPSYDPWDQRLCAVPDADLFRSIKRGDAEVVTDAHRLVRPRGDPAAERPRPGGRHRGHRHRAEPAAVRRHRAVGRRRGGRPAPSSSSGRARCSPGCRTSPSASATPTPPGRCAPTSPTGWCAGCSTTWSATTTPPPYRCRARSSRSDRCSHLSSGYIQRAIAEFPRQGHRGPWRVRQNYILDSLTTMRRGLRGSMEFTPRSAVRRHRVVCTESLVRSDGAAARRLGITPDPGAR